MAWQPPLKKQIEAPGSKSLGPSVSEAERKADVISDYLTEYAAIDGKVVTPYAMEVYIKALGDLSLRQLEKGLNKYLQQGERWPWPGTLRLYCEEEI